MRKKTYGEELIESFRKVLPIFIIGSYVTGIETIVLNSIKDKKKRIIAKRTFRKLLRENLKVVI